MMLQTAIDKRTYEAVEQNYFADIMPFSKCLFIIVVATVRRKDYTDSDYTLNVLRNPRFFNCNGYTFVVICRPGYGCRSCIS